MTGSRIQAAKLLLAGTGMCALSGIPLAAHAQAAKEENRISEIIVTATRSEASAQKVPIALTPISGEDLAKVGVTNAAELSQLSPSLYVQAGVAAGSPRYSIRGVTGSDDGPYGQAAVASYFDDVYQVQQYGMGANLFDLGRVEVLRGPQGTTFGKNTTAGAVSSYSQPPTNNAEGYVFGRLASGDRSERMIQGAVNVPLIDGVLATRGSFNVVSRGNYVTDITQNRKLGASDELTGRFQLRFTPSDDFTANLAVYSTRHRGDGPLYHIRSQDPCSVFFSFLFCDDNGRPAVPLALDDPERVSYTRLESREDFDNTGATLRIEKDFGFGKLTAITHWRNTITYIGYDLDGTPADFRQIYYSLKSEQYGQELRFTTDQSAPIRGLFGFFYQHNNTGNATAQAVTERGIPFDNYADRDDHEVTNDFAVFGSLAARLNERVSLTGGVRKSFENKRAYGQVNYFLAGNYDWNASDIFYSGPAPVAPSSVQPWSGRQNNKPWTWDAALNFQASQNLLIFARTAKGFRSGGFNPPRFRPGGTLEPFRPETIQSYEVGIKADLLDRKLRINAAAFHYNYNNQQVSQVKDGFFGTTNAGKAKVDGAEIEMTVRPVKGLELVGSLGYSDARFTQYLDSGADYSGNPLQQAPKWTATWGMNYTLPVSGTHDLRLSTNWSHRSAIFFDPTKDPLMGDNARTTGRLRVAYEPTEKGLGVAVFANNITNTKARAFAFAWQPGYVLTTYLTGISYGMDLTYRW